MTVLPINGDWKLFLARWGAGGLAAAVTLKILEQPKLAESVIGWGPLFVIVVVAMIGADRRFGEFVAATKENAVATAQLAASVEVLSRRDDKHAQAVEAAIGYVAQTNETILRELRQLRTEKKDGG